MRSKACNLSNRPLFPTQSDRALFVDREAEIEQIVESMKSGYNVLVLGQRGAGKTSLLYRIYDIAPSMGLSPVPCRFWKPPRDHSDFLGMLIQALISESDSHKHYVRGTAEPTRGVFGTLRDSARTDAVGGPLYQTGKNMEITNGPYSYRALETLLDELAKGGRRVAFLVDNLSESLEHFRRAFGGLRDYLWSLRTSFVVTADFSAREILVAPPVGSFFETTVTLSGFNRRDTERALRLRGFGDMELTGEIHTASSGNPLIVMMLARRVALGELSGDELRTKIVRRARLLEEFGPVERAVIAYVDELGAASASDTTLQGSAGVSRTRLVQVLKELEAEDIMKSRRRGKRVYYSLTSEWELYRGAAE